jgi:ribosomal protein S12 methylthiotransferase
MTNARIVHLISLGCPKNLVDSEIMAGLLEDGGYTLSSRPDDARIIIVNTCAFILPAKEESIDEIFRMAEWKRKGNCSFLVVTGCLPQRYGKTLGLEMPEVDLFLGTAEVANIRRHLENLEQENKRRQRVVAGRPSFLMNAGLPRRLSDPIHTAYLKIAEGCSNRCSYCAIPAIRGSFRSRPPDDILQEASILVKQGVKEIIITAQDSSAYGRDLKNGHTLSRLLRELSAVEDIKWIRILYAHPASITEELLETITAERKVCRYLDMPVQHIDDRILKAMNRLTTSDRIRRLISDIRSAIPDVALRTSIIVGFPGETKTVFNDLLEFIKEARFDHLGAFTYSKEEGTGAADLPSRISKKEKEMRRQMLMEEQAVISYHVNLALRGTIQDVLIEGNSDDPVYPFIGRCRRQAPDIDGITYVRGNKLKPGDIIPVRIIDSCDYDLYAETQNKKKTQGA